MPYNFIYVDDTFENLEQGTINALQDGGDIVIDFKRPNDWEELMTELTRDLPNNNGLILDLRLNGNPYEGNNYAKYRGSTLAQELRTLAKENLGQKDYPIVLISADKNIELSLDQTSYDLFEMVVNKNHLGNDKKLSYAAFKNKLCWLSEGYDYLNVNDKSKEYILGRKEIPALDPRFLESLTNVLNKPGHILARFIIKEIIGRPTFLINEAYLAARLGIDPTSPDWPKFVNEIIPSDACYTGAFSSRYPRWWMNEIEKFWNENFPGQKLRNLPASKRLELISAKFNLTDLKAPTRTAKSKSDAFWVVCKATGVPLDTTDGFMISGQDDKYSWQESQYISIDEALRPTQDYLNISSIEKPRLQKLKEIFEQHEQRVRK